MDSETRRENNRANNAQITKSLALDSETKRENKQIESEGKGEAVEEISSRDIGKKAPKETELAKDYKEALEKVSKKAKENAKKDFVERNFDSIVEKLKIQIKCPT